MNVKLIAHTQLNQEFLFDILSNEVINESTTNGQMVALSSIRTCYSPLKPSEIVFKEGSKYFDHKASDGTNGSDADRLFRHIIHSGHTSTLEHITFTFAIESVSRALLSQLTRHRIGFSFSVQSQRYVRFGSNDKSGGFEYTVPDKIEENIDALYAYETFMSIAQNTYDTLRSLGIPPEDARAVLPINVNCNLVMTVNLRALLDFYKKRKHGNGAQKEIADLAEMLKDEVINVEPFTKQFFEN